MNDTPVIRCLYGPLRAPLPLLALASSLPLLAAAALPSPHGVASAQAVFSTLTASWMAALVLVL